MNAEKTDTVGLLSSIRWPDLIAAGIRTTDTGPFEEDVFWQYLLPDGVVEIPSCANVPFDELTAHLPGFDARKVITAMTWCKERVFRIWHHAESREPLEPAALQIRFEHLFHRLGPRRSAHDIAARVLTAWSSAARRYHDVEHLTECLREVDRIASTSTRDLLELALFYHDAIYEAGAPDCEVRSAAWLLDDARALGLPEHVAQASAALVRATAHAGGAATSEAEATILDIDLSILGRDPLRFLEYEYGVAEEHASIPAAAFRRGRSRFLSRLLEAPIYRTPAYRDRFEAPARANVTALLRSWRYRGSD